MNRTTTLELKDGKIIAHLSHPYVVNTVCGTHMGMLDIVYHATYHPYDGGKDDGTCGYIRHDTIVSRSNFKGISNWESLFVKGEVFNAKTGSNMTLK